MMLFWVLFYWVGGATLLVGALIFIGVSSPWLLPPLGLFMVYSYVCGFNALMEEDLRRL